jgi:hypothetical protein
MPRYKGLYSERIQVMITKEQGEIIKKLIGKIGGTESEVVRNILIMWLRKEGYLK